MTTPGAPQPRTEVLEWVQTWSQSLGQVLTQVAGIPFGVDSAGEPPPEALPPMETDLHGIVTAAGTLRGEMSLRLPRNVVLSLAQLFLSEPQDPVAEFKPDHRDAAEELLRQVAGQAATALKPRWGEVQLRLEFGPPPSWSAGDSGWMVAALGAPGGFWLEWQTSAALVAALRAAKTAAVAPESAAVALPAASADTAPSPELGSKLDLLMDVELGVTLRFGGRRLLLREILELGPGSVVELDRQVQEPADLLLDGKLIARGEVVVVDGNYGLRVLEVIAPAMS
jgi:flagellar motor switch protein FliN/FliY